MEGNFFLISEKGAILQMSLGNPEFNSSKSYIQPYKSTLIRQ